MKQIFNHQTTKMDKLIQQILKKIEDLELLVSDVELRLEYLEQENVGTTNELYELQNRLDILDNAEYHTFKNLTPTDV